MEFANQTVPQPSYLISSLKLAEDQKPPESTRIRPTASLNASLPILLLIINVIIF